MTPEEIVAEINSNNRQTLCTKNRCEEMTREQILALMDAAAMRGFQFGSNMALSMVQGALVVQLSKVVSSKDRSKSIGDACK